MTSPTVQTTEELPMSRELLTVRWSGSQITEVWDGRTGTWLAVSPKVVTTVAELRARVMTVLTENGMTEGGNMHGWRCEYPDRYGPCDCCDLLADDLVAVLDSTSPVPPSEVK